MGNVVALKKMIAPPVKPALVWEEGPAEIQTAKVARGSKYSVYPTAMINHGPGYVARRTTRNHDFIVVGHADTLEQAKQLCERHYTEGKA
jgi:hypothetical protein